VSPFSENINVSGEILLFSFFLIHTVQGIKFFISGRKEHHPFVFDMQKNRENKWKILEPAPAWAKLLEPALADIIEKHL
jgi:hypothetical protein